MRRAVNGIFWTVAAIFVAGPAVFAGEAAGPLPRPLVLAQTAGGVERVSAIPAVPPAERPETAPASDAETLAANVLVRRGITVPARLVRPGLTPAERDVETPLSRAMDVMRDGDWDRALELAANIGPVAHDIIAWHWLRAGKGDFDSARAFLARRGDWPGLPYLQRRMEGRVPYRQRPGDVIAFFAGRGPQTGAGHIVLAAAYEEAGMPEKAQPLLIAAWTEHDLNAADERYLLERYGEFLKPYHIRRMDYLLWEGETKAAERLLPRVSRGWQALARARIGLREGVPGVDGLIAKVPAALRNDPGLAYERFLWRLNKGRTEGAREILLERAAMSEGLGQPRRFGNWRRILARQDMRAGNAKTAYQLAATHGMRPEDGNDFADLEWLAGYLSLTYLGRPEQALRHFRAFRAAVETPISLGRAGYWEGRAYEALGHADAAAQAYAFGAEYQSSFYGQLAAERAGLPFDPTLAGAETRPSWREASFVGSSVLEAARQLRDAGERDLAERFLTHLTESLSPREAAQLADFALELEEPHVALMIGKRAASAGVVIPHAYFPVVDLGLDDFPVSEALALSIARRESEFDPGVRSPAGALGLMQVMPGTGKDMAEEVGVAYSRNRLQEDPVYNARLGVAYLRGLIERFGPNIVLVAAGYNAGPGRPIAWMEERGDPRGGGIDVVDWIEHIPFRETRNYVMRVSESLPIYEARLMGRPAPTPISTYLTAR